MTPEWQAWRRLARLTKARMARIIRNQSRLGHVVTLALLDRIDAAIARDHVLLDAALEAEE